MTENTAPNENPTAEELADDAANAKRRAIIKPLYKSITQREWLGICRALDEVKEDITDREELLMPALAWVAQKRNNGTQDWDRILDMTDEQIIDAIGMDVPEDSDDDDPKGMGKAPDVYASSVHDSSSPVEALSPETNTTSSQMTS